MGTRWLPGAEQSLAVSRTLPATERDLYWEWVRAEVDVSPHGPRSGRLTVHELDRRVLSILARGDREELLESDWAELELAFRRLRGDYLDPLLDGHTTWRYGELPVTEVAELRIPNLTISLVPLAPSRRLEEYVAALDAGREIPNLPNLAVYREMRREFVLSSSRGCPVLVSERVGGPYVIAEGLTRASVLTSLLGEGRTLPSFIRVLLGTSPRVRDWAWW